MADQIPSYQIKSLTDLTGETWKDIPGFEGSYQASTLGRIKSLDRTIPHPRLYQQFVKGQILSQSISRNRNIKTGEPMIDLRVTLGIENVQYYFNTRRLIYKTFIDPHLDYKNDGMYVINADNDGYNNKPENLRLVTKSEKQLRAVKRGRVSSFLKDADRSNWRKNHTSSKPVEQYDQAGQLIQTYPSVKEASRQLNLADKAIIQVAKGIYKQWNGFVWKYANK
jgi:beta-lactam-binding protein with PASTA domain